MPHIVTVAFKLMPLDGNGIIISSTIGGLVTAEMIPTLCNVKRKKWIDSYDDSFDLNDAVNIGDCMM
jgi:hypothetical protein